MGSYTIGAVAERSGFSASSLRYYEGIGLVRPSARTDAGYRLYDDRTLSRLAFIACAKQLGCSLDEISDLVKVWDGERCAPVQRRLHELVTAKLGATRDQIVDLSGFATELSAAARRLNSPPSDGPCDDDCACVGGGVEPAAGRGSTAQETDDADPPIACTLGTDAMPDRLAEWQAILDHVTARVGLPDGSLRISLGPDVDLGALARVVAAEQQCCSFFRFTITVDRRGIALEVGAPDEAADLLAMVFGSPK